MICLYSKDFLWQTTMSVWEFTELGFLRVYKEMHREEGKVAYQQH